MTQQETQSAISFDDLRSLAVERGPCITAGIAIPNPLQLHARIQNTIRGIEKRLKDLGGNSEDESELVEPIKTFARAIEAERQWSVGLVLYRSPDLFRHFLLRDAIEDFVTVSLRFQIRPLVSLMSREQTFYVLCLSEKHTRLFLYTYQCRQELDLRRLAPQTLQVWMNTRTPDHVLDNRSAGGPSLGKMKGVMFGTSTDRERHDEYLRHFFKEIDEGVRRIVESQTGTRTPPMILVGVEEEVALYRRVNSYPHLAERAVVGSAEGFEPNELHERVMDIGREMQPPLLQKALNQVKEAFGTQRAVFEAGEIVQRAEEGRVADLLLREDEGPRDDLLNLAALKTIQHRGHAFAVKKSLLPDGTDVVALLRY
jgi:hypothetical protein